MCASKKKKEVAIKKEPVSSQFIAILSQKKPHEILAEFNKILQVQFERKLIHQRELFQATDNDYQYFFLSGSDFAGFHSDYVMIVISSTIKLIDIKVFNDLKRREIVQGVYLLPLTKKQSKEILGEIL